MKTKNVLFPEPAEVTIGRGEEAKTFEILPLVRKKYKKLLKMFGDIVQDLMAGNADSFAGIDLNKLEENIVPLIDLMGDKMLDIYVLVLNVDTEWLDDNMLAHQEMDLVTAIFEQNDIGSIAKNFRKMASKIRPEAAPIKK